MSAATYHALMNSNLDGEKVLVLASSKGLGKAVAEQFVARGARVALTSRKLSNLEAAKADIVDRQDVPEDRIVVVECDMTDEGAISRGVESAVAELGGLTVLVTNHGGPQVETFETATVAGLDTAYEAVLRSTFLVLQATLPHLLKGDGGAITNIVSASAQEPSPTNIFSNLLRPGLYGLSKSLSREYGPEGLRVNCVCPRGILTDRIKHKVQERADRQDITYEQAYEQRIDAVPLGRLGSPEEFGKAVVFISSDDASFITGAALSIDGGWLHGMN